MLLYCWIETQTQSVALNVSFPNETKELELLGLKDVTNVENHLLFVYPNVFSFHVYFVDGPYKA